MDILVYEDEMEAGCEEEPSAAKAYIDGEREYGQRDEVAGFQKLVLGATKDGSINGLLRWSVSR